MKRSVVFVVLVVLLALLLAGTPASTGAQQTNAQKALAHVSKTEGVPVDNLRLVGETTQKFPLIGETVWAGIIIDMTTSARPVYRVYIDSKGSFVDIGEVRAREQAAGTGRPPVAWASRSGRAASSYQGQRVILRILCHHSGQWGLTAGGAAYNHRKLSLMRAS